MKALALAGLRHSRRRAGKSRGFQLHSSLAVPVLSPLQVTAPECLMTLRRALILGRAPFSRALWSGVASSHGQSYLGCSGHADDVAAPTPLPQLASSPCAVSDAGWGHSVFLGVDGSVCVLGRPSDFRNTLRAISQRAHAPAMQRLTAAITAFFFPTDVAPKHFPARAGGDRWVHVACAHGAGTALLTADGAIDAFGANAHGQVGAGVPDMAIHEPMRVLAGWPADERVVSVALGLEHALAATDRGGVYAWGKGARGALGFGVRDNVLRPARVVGTHGALLSERIRAVEAGAGASYAIDAKGRAWVWGKMMGSAISEKSGIGGVQLQEDALEPRLIEFDDEREGGVVAGSADVVAEMEGEEECVWTTEPSHVPGAVVARADTPREPIVIYDASSDAIVERAQSRRRRLRAITAGQAHASLLTDDGRLWMLGARGAGVEFDDSVGASRFPSLARGAMQTTPLEIEAGPLQGHAVRALRSSLHHSYAITADGSVFRWGWKGVVEPWRPERLLRTEEDCSRAARGGAWAGRVKDVQFGYAHAVSVL